MGLWAKISQLVRKFRNEDRRRFDADDYRRCRFETMEGRRLLNADPVRLGVVYVEEDFGSDLHGDTFELTFVGGAPGTELNQVVINGDQELPGFSAGDVIFDTQESGRGADHAFPFQIVSLQTADPSATVQASVEDGTSKLTLDFTRFRAGDKLVFSIDVDEVEDFDPAETDLDRINDGIDPITSGVEFQSSKLTGNFSAPHYHDISGTSEFRNRYDDLLVGTGLNLPADDAGGKRDRTDGAVLSLIQTPLPIGISGTVFLERDLDLVQDGGEPGIADVELGLWQKQGGNYVFTGHTTRTDAQGNYRFGTDLNLLPGTYQVRETQPVGLFSVGAIPGTVAGATSGSTVAGNRDVLTEINIPLGGQLSIDNDFAEAQPAKISGNVYHDRSNDGQFGPGEEGLAGVSIQVIPVNTIAPQDTVTVLTDQFGAYRADNLAPGTYRVVESAQPAGYFDGLDTPGTVEGSPIGTVTNPGDSLEAIFLGGGQAGVDYNFGEIAPASIRGRVDLTDKDGNCAGETGVQRPVADAVVRLYDNNGTQIAETRTNAQGEYSFTGLKPGTYKVVELTPAGLLDGAAHAGNVNGETRGAVTDKGTVTSIVLGSGDQGVNFDFCEHEPATVSGYVYHDVNENGLIEPGEELIADVEVELRDADGNVVGTTKTNANGHYEFLMLSRGTYSVLEKQPGGWLDGRDTSGFVDGAPVGTASNDALRGIALGWGQDGVEYNFGELQPGSITGRVHADKDGDCELDADEQALGGVTIQLLNANNEVIATTQTNDQGIYQFTGLTPGVYGVRELQPTGYFHGDQHAGSHGGNDSQSDLITQVRIGSGQALVDYNFCEIPPASLTGLVFLDPNGDCEFNPGDSPLSSVTVQLLNAQGNVVATTQTNADGVYKFENLAPGTYAVREIQPTGVFQGGQKPGSGGGVVLAEDLIGQISIGAGQNLVNYDFCELPPSSLAGRVYSDPNGDCEFNNGDSPIANVTVQLLNSQGQIVATAKTGADGRYKFENLAPGVYSVRELQPEGLFQHGTSPGSGGGVVAGDDFITQIQIAGGQDLVDYDFCETPPAGISGFVFQDGATINTANGLAPSNLGQIRDGLKTPDDSPIAGVLLQLRDGFTGAPIDGSEALPGSYASGPIQTYTDANGFYEFHNLPGGRSYAIYQVHPTGYIDSIDTVGSTTGFAFNPQVVGTLEVAPLADQPPADAIIRIAVAPGELSQNNNFSEVKVQTTVLPPPNPPNPPNPPLPPPPPSLPPQVPSALSIPARSDPPPVYVAWSPPRLGIYENYAGSSIGYSWHLSVINGGMPRDLASASRGDEVVWRTATHLDTTQWQTEQLQQGRWMVGVSADGSSRTSTRSLLFGIRGAIPFSGDFNGDGKSEMGLFYRGEWFIDLNGNGQWDEEDLWARLGDELDRPVIGDWDGDGKDDIGIYGPEWFGDQRQIDREPGLPDSSAEPGEFTTVEPKNLPPNLVDATDGQRLLRLGAGGPRRADVIDHVFRYGESKDAPVSGDWNGDGIRTVGIFQNGEWRVDMNGDGLTNNADRTWRFGTAGDIPVVGDWDGNGVEDIGVYRGGKWILDMNGNHEIDAHDQVFELGGPLDQPVVGDWNGDGIDDPATYHDIAPAAPAEIPVSRQ